MRKLLAYIRPTILNDGELPPISLGGIVTTMPPEMTQYKFISSQPDELANEEFNLVLELDDGTTFRAMAMDFEFDISEHDDIIPHELDSELDYTTCINDNAYVSNYLSSILDDVLRCFYADINKMDKEPLTSNETKRLLNVVESVIKMKKK